MGLHQDEEHALELVQEIVDEHICPVILQTYGAENHPGWVKFRNLRIHELPDTPH